MNNLTARFGSLVRREPVDLGLACLLISASPAPGQADSLVADSQHALDELARQVPASGPADERLRHVLGGFMGGPEDYESLESSLLSPVLQRHRGLPITLSVVWLEVARRVQIPAYGIGLPGHFIIGLGDPDGHHVFVDPYRGGRILRTSQLSELVGDQVGPHHLRPWEPIEILQRILANIRHWANTTDRIAIRRWALELTLALPRHALALRSEYGQTMVALGGFLEGAQALEEFANAIEAADETAAESARTDARRARARLN